MIILEVAKIFNRSGSLEMHQKQHRMIPEYRYIKNIYIIRVINPDLGYYNQSTWRGFKVIPFSNPKIKDYLKNYDDLYSQYSDIIVSTDKRISLVPLTN